MFVFVPNAVEPALGRHGVNKVQRWALFMYRFSNGVELADGNENSFTDILTLWKEGYRNHFSDAVCNLVLESSEKLIPTSD